MGFSLERLGADDEEAQGLFWKEHWGEVYGICYRILQKKLLANETAVDILTDFMLECAHRLKYPGAVKSYLRLMAIRRSVRIKERLGQTEPLSMVPPVPSGLEDRAHYQSLMPRLDECLSRLSPKAQKAIRLRFCDELTQERIGGLLGGSKQYIGKLITKSLKFLRECMAGGFSSRANPGGRRK
jgi:RNA polymerase sigma factor (sigma-70 family)